MELATHSNILAWKIPWTEEPGGNRPGSYKESDIAEWITLTNYAYIDVKSSVFLITYTHHP